MIRAEKLSKTYVSRAGVVHAISDLSFSVRKGTCLLLQGPSGSGKSTLLNLIGCLTQPTSGAIFIDGREVSHLPDQFLTEVRRRKIGIVFQAFNLLQGVTAVDSVAMPLLPLGVHHASRHQRALALLQRVNLGHRAHFRVNELSGGEQQRVAMARALVNDPELIIADEPNSSIDQQNGRMVMDMLQALKREGKTLLVSSHDPAFEGNGLVDDVLTLGAIA